MPFPTDQRHKLGEILTKAAFELDIPDHVYEDAILKYEAVSAWLAAEDSELVSYSPDIYPQGSFRLGTVVRPIGRSDYDVDLVCTLNLRKNQTTQAALKNMVGNRLKKNPDLQKIISPLRRCWLLDYPAQPNGPSFHMDVLPSLPNPERPPAGILLTDTDLVMWQKSNPKAYADWFHERMRMILMEKRAALAKANNVSVEQVPEWQVKTPLQIAVQILKRHRDIYFRSDLDNRPVSIILTTLAASAYRNQADIFDAITAIARDMPKFIEYRNSQWWVANPVEPEENFADKWNEYPSRRENFGSWLERVQYDFAQLVQRRNLYEAVEGLKEPLGNDLMAKVASGLDLPGIANHVLASPVPTVAPLADFRHLKEIPWPVLQQYYKAAVTASVHLRRHAKKLWDLADRNVPKRIWLRFTLKTNVPLPYEVSWQVVNTGKEASTSGQLRGGFYEGEASSNNVRWEPTLFNGTHWVEAFVVKSGVCVARSGRVYVKVRG